MADSDILIQGAREHNLRDVSLVLPRNRLICFTGVSGSGKSSLAFDTLYAEGQRRYVESLSSFARQFLGQMPKPDVDLIAGLSPAISISQKSSGTNPRSTVGTITEIYDYLRVLFARVGKGHCPECHRPITAQTREQIIDRIGMLAGGTRFLVLAPLIRGQKGEYRDLFEDLLKQGFVRARVDGRVVRLTDDLRLDRQMRHNIEVVVDRLVAGPKIRPRLAEAVELALRLGEGNLIVAGGTKEERGETGTGEAEGGRTEAREDGRPPFRPFLPLPLPLPPSDLSLSAHYACTHCQKSFEPPSPQLFSFNSPQGMCPECSGLGQIYSFDPRAVDSRAQPLVSAGLHRAVGQMAGDGPMEAAHLPRRGGNARAEVRAFARHRVGNGLGRTRRTGPAGPALGHRRRARHVHVAGRGLGLQMGRTVRRDHSQALGAVPQHPQPSAAQATGKVHADPRLRAMPWPPAQRPGLRGDA